MPETAATATVRSIRHALGRVKRELFPSPERAAWRAAVRQAARAERFAPGQITMAGYDIAYADLLTLCPNWCDIFVSRVLAFHASHGHPRIVDCGANVGLASLFFARAYPQASIVAFEADPALAAICRRNMAVNGADGVEVRHAAVWTSNGTIDFCCEGADAGAIQALGTGVTGSTSAVPAVRLRDLIADGPPIDLLKIDIEGAEYDVLADCADVLPRVPALLIDVHEFDRSHRRMPELLLLLERAGFQYAIDHLMTLPWRGEAARHEPFAGTATAWGLLVRAWRP